MDGPLGPKESPTRVWSSDIDARLGDVFVSSSIAMCVVDEGGIIRRVNDAMCRLLSRTRCEVLGSHLTEPTHAEDRAVESALLLAATNGRSNGFDLEKRILRGDDDLLWCRSTATVLPDVAPRVLLVETLDTSAEHALAERNRTVEERVKLTTAAAQDAFVGMNADGVIIEWNKAAEAMFGWPADEVVGRTLSSTIVPQEQREAHERGLARYFATGDGPVLNKKVEVQALRRDGVEFRVELTIWPVAGDSGVEFNAFLRDVSERLRFQEELRRLAIAATTDQGTGLQNRRGFFALAEHEMSLAHRLGHPLTLIFFDLDRLKEINDTLGHLEGDRAIADTAHILSTTFRESDLVARLGGDEFCVLALGPREAFANTMRRFEAALDEHNANSDRPFTLSLSYGVAFFDPAEGPASLDELMSKADASMYLAKLGPRSA